MEKQCTKCGVIKPIDQYRKNSYKKKDGLDVWCIECREKQRTSYNGRRSSMVTDAKKRAKKKGILFNITYEDITIPDHCPVLGIPLFHSTGGPADNSPTLDRIVPELGYVSGNVIVISKLANQMKSSATKEDIIKLYKWAIKTL